MNISCRWWKKLLRFIDPRLQIGHNSKIWAICPNSSLVGCTVIWLFHANDLLFILSLSRSVFPPVTNFTATIASIGNLTNSVWSVAFNCVVCEFMAHASWIHIRVRSKHLEFKLERSQHLNSFELTLNGHLSWWPDAQSSQSPKIPNI